MTDPMLHWQCRRLAEWCERKMQKHMRERRGDPWPTVSIARALTDLASRYRRIVAPLVPIDGDFDQASHICACFYDDLGPSLVADGIEQYIQETLDP